MLVNTASECGFTYQYSGLEELWKKYGDRGLVIIGIPTNDFGGQEPGSDEHIESFCTLNYGVTFPLSSKLSASGSTKHEVFKFTRTTFGMLSGPSWNFYKYLFNKNGEPIDWYSSKTEPMASKLVKSIEDNL